MNSRGDGDKLGIKQRRVQRLAIFAERLSSRVDAQADSPTLPEVCYTPPNPDGSRKMCRNCVLWIGGDQQCYILSEEVVVPPNAVCNYHVYGRSELTRAKEFDPVDPYYAGFMETRQGSSCDKCEYYTPTSQEDGTCSAVADSVGANAIVAALGCCSRFESK